MFSKLIFSVPSKYLSSVSQAYSLEIIHFKKKWIPPCFPLRWYSFICWLYHQRSRVGPQQGAFWPPSLTAIEAIFGSEAKKKLYSFFQRMSVCIWQCTNDSCSIFAVNFQIFVNFLNSFYLLISSLSLLWSENYAIWV